VAGGVRRLFWVDRQGKAEPFPQPPRGYLHPRFSPDGRTLAVEVEGSNHDFWLYDLERGTFTRMTSDGRSHWPLWTPDGSRLTFRVGMPGPFNVWWMPADRNGPQQRLTESTAWQSAASWSPDGKAAAFTQITRMFPPTRPDVWVLEMGKPRPFADSKFSEGAPRFSPDGKWIAYVSDETGRNEVYVQSYPGPGPKIQMSVDGGTDPVWASRTGELFYRNDDKMMVVAVTLRPAFRAGKPQLLWTGHYSHGMSTSCGPPGTTSSNYDVTPDGQRFLMITDSEQDATPTQVNVVLNWVEEVKRLVEEKEKRKR
jgi:serine/threonine-protein kinase